MKKGRTFMKKFLSLLLAVSLLLTACLTSGAFALDYKATLGNEATFETYTEARENAPKAMTGLVRGTPAMHAAMADYPGDTTYIYRSPDMWGLNAAARLNTSIIVYTDKTFAAKDEALAYITDLGLVDIVNEIRGAVILITPSSEAGFGAADQKNYYKLQSALLGINAAGTNEAGEPVTYVDASYYGTYGFLYVIGIDGGATFVNNFVASQFDFVSRIAGMLLINGQMDRIREVGAFLPVYLVNAPAAVKAKYEKVNGVDSLRQERAKKIEYNKQFPLRQVVILDTAEPDLPAIVKDAYYNMFVKAQRGQEIEEGLYTAGQPYQGTGYDTVPYSLSPRNAVFGDHTVDGIYLKEVKSEMFADIKTEAGEYLQTWFEFLPEEVLNGTAKEGSIPLLLALHGGGDDPRQYVDGQGWLELAGKERIAIVAPDKANLHVNDTEGNDYHSRVMPLLVKYMLETYPALDASRVYANGYSMGSLSTCRVAYGAPEMFAAVYPQCGFRGANPTEEDAKKFENVDLPIVMSTTEYNMRYASDISSLYGMINDLLRLNGMDPLPEEKDFEKYPISGFEADLYTCEKINDDYVNHTWFMCKDGVPMVGASFVECINHCLYPQYANIIWDFFKHYSRDLTTGEVVYNPYVR